MKCNIDKIYSPKTLCRYPWSLCSEKNNKSIVSLNNRDIPGLIESRCSQGMTIQIEAISEAVKKNNSSS